MSSAEGILGLQECYSKVQLKKSCGYIFLLAERARNYASMPSILKYGRDQLLEEVPTPQFVVHENLHGGAYNSVLENPSPITRHWMSNNCCG